MTKKFLFSGAIPALITPFKEQRIDEAALISLVEWHVSQGSDALVIAGTTGEAPTLDMSEHVAAVAIAVRAAQGRIPIIGGAGSNSTREAVELTRQVEHVGASGTLHAAGYYNKPSQQQLVQHFLAVADVAMQPILLYNVPGRTGVDLSIETVAMLSRCERIVGIKDATGDLSRVALEIGSVKRDGFCFFSGDDSTALGYVAYGGVGCISVTANVAPMQYAQMIHAAMAGDIATARAINARLAGLHKLLFAEPSPGPTKYALSLLGRCANELRAPLGSISPTLAQAIEHELRSAELL